MLEGILIYSWIGAVNPLQNWHFYSNINYWQTENVSNMTIQAFQNPPLYANGGYAYFRSSQGRRIDATGNLIQSFYVSNAPSSVTLSFGWLKNYEVVEPLIIDMSITIVKPDLSEVTLWTHSGAPPAWNVWNTVSNLDVSSAFPSTGTYTIKLKGVFRTGNNSSAVAIGEFDEIDLVLRYYYTMPTSNTATVDSPTQITALSYFDGDEDYDGSTSFEICTDAECSSPVNMCDSVTGSSPRVCVMSGLASDTNYWIKFTHSDPDGVIGTNPQIIGPFFLDGTPPSFEGIKGGYDAGKGGIIRAEFNPASDSSPPIRYNLYYNDEINWSNSDWSLNQKIADCPTFSGEYYPLACTAWGLNDGVVYVIGVRAEDRFGNEDSNSITAIVIPTDRRIRLGYNLVSDAKVPQPPHNTAQAIFGDDTFPYRPYLYRWNSTGLSFNPPFKGYYSKSLYVQNGTGYWLYSLVGDRVFDDDLNPENTSPQSYIPLQPGWNIIGNPYLKRVKLADVMVEKLNPPNAGLYTYEEAVLNGWVNNAIYFWNGSGYSFEAYNGNPPAYLRPYVGCWLYVGNDSGQFRLVVNKP